jgi:hypothetical protein
MAHDESLSTRHSMLDSPCAATDDCTERPCAMSLDSDAEHNHLPDFDVS